jgi:endonuclease-3
MNRTKCQAIFARLAAANPHPTTELRYTTAFELLVAVILSAQATDKGVNKVTAQLFAVANTPQQILDLGEEQLKDYIRSLGLFNTKARNLIATCNMLATQHNHEVPGDRSALEALPGVGRKTANVVLNTAFGQPTLAVDTHVFRVANRTGLALATTPIAVEQQLLQLIPEKFHLNAHHWLILHGRFTCTARKPKCVSCILWDLCEYPDKT